VVRSMEDPVLLLQMFDLLFQIEGDDIFVVEVCDIYRCIFDVFSDDDLR